MTGSILSALTWVKKLLIGLLHLKGWEFWYFGVCGESLYVIEVNSPRDVLFDVFEMTRDYSQWIFKFLY